jgi:acetolactate synthase-1/2/3 large subunit
MWETNPYYGGRFGPYGDQRGNDLVASVDCLLILGERLYVWQIGYDYENWAKQAYKIMVDIDTEELDKPTMRTQLKVHADVKDFLLEMNKQL